LFTSSPLNSFKKRTSTKPLLLSQTSGNQMANACLHELEQGEDKKEEE